MRHSDHSTLMSSFHSLGAALDELPHSADALFIPEYLDGDAARGRQLFFSGEGVITPVRQHGADGNAAFPQAPAGFLDGCFHGRIAHTSFVDAPKR